MFTSMIERFEMTAGALPEKIAAVHDEHSITFAELRRRARALGSRLAHLLGVRSKIPVAVLLPKEINVLIADIAILYAGRPFVDLDVKTPKERLASITGSIMPAAIVTDRKHAHLIAGDGAEIVYIDDLDGMTDDPELLRSITERAIDTDPMCIINTSGSTGVPKGVVLNTRSFVDFMQWADSEFNFCGSEVIGSLSPVVFDIFVFELTMLMMHGSQLVLLDAMLAAFPARLLQAIDAARVDLIFWVPTIMVNIANMDLLSKTELPHLKLVWFAGEVFPVKQFCYWYDHLPHAEFVNLYGPIEITLDCTFHRIRERPKEDEPLPIGIPCRNTDILLLNEDDELCGVGEEGELCVRGTSLAMGYYNAPDKTAAAFVQDPLNTSYPELIYRTGDIACIGEDGLIHFKGRRDTLIKHMGYRIELAEIEHTVENTLQLADHCCAVYRQEQREIVLFYEGGGCSSDHDLRKALAKVFPAYMIPKIFVKLDALPQNTNGKIDRLMLKKAANGAGTPAEGASELGLRVCSI